MRPNGEFLSWTTPRQLEALLPASVPIAIRGGVDRYGFSYELARLCGLRRPPRAFANWVHGWIWDESPTAESLACAKLPREVTIVVRNQTEAAALRREGFQHVVVGGLPFAYVDEQHVARNPHALLAIPPHSAEVEKLTSQQGDYMDYLESLKGDYDGVYVSIHYMDWNGPMHKAAAARKLNAVQGARPDDANSVARMRAIFDAFSHVTSNTIGSHFVYSLFAGCKFSFSGPMFMYDADMFLGGGNPHGHRKERIDRLAEIQSQEYLRRRFPHFFRESPREAVMDTGFAADELGANSLLAPAQIMGALGWSSRGQVAGYMKGAVRRLRRSLRKQTPA